MPDYRKIAGRKARKYGLNPRVFKRQINQESGFNPRAVSPAGARGIAQIMPDTARGWGVNPDKPRQALDAAARNMADYVKEYGSYEAALRAYNAGPGNIERSKGFAETNNYVRTILGGREPKPILRQAGTPGGQRVFQPGRVDLQRVSSFDREGFEQASQRARVGAFLAERRGTDSILFRSGLLSTAAPDREDFTSSRLQSKMIPGRMVDGDALPSSGQVSKAVKAARVRLGVREVNGTNTGPNVDRMQQRFGMIGQPWCGIFVGTALKKAGVQGVTSRVASVQAIEEDAKQGANGFRSWHNPRQAQRGDALVTRQAGHVGLVVRVDRKRGVIHTIEGNTGNGEVARRTHRMSDVYGVARPRYRRG